MDIHSSYSRNHNQIHSDEAVCTFEMNHNNSWALKWASYQIRKIAGCACAGNAGNVFPRRRFQRKPIVGDPGMHHGTCVTHVPWCMSGSLTCGDGENVPGIPGACAPAILRIWQEAHIICSMEIIHQDRGYCFGAMPNLYSSIWDYTTNIYFLTCGIYVLK